MRVKRSLTLNLMMSSFFTVRARIELDFVYFLLLKRTNNIYIYAVLI